MEKMTSKQFKKQLKKVLKKQDILVFGKSGMGGPTMVSLLSDEQNQAPTETMKGGE